jgi:hypothetical protein
MMMNINNFELFKEDLKNMSSKKVIALYEYFMDDLTINVKKPTKSEIEDAILNDITFLEKKWVLDTNRSHECSVCFNSYADNDDNYIILECNHDTCLKCCINIFETSKKCPICRFNIDHKYISENIDKKEYSKMKRLIVKEKQTELGIIPIRPPPSSFIAQPIAYLELNDEMMKHIPFIIIITIIYLVIMYLYLAYPIIWLFAFIDLNKETNILAKVCSSIIITTCVSIYVYNYPAF